MSLLSKCPTCDKGVVTNSHKVCRQCGEKKEEEEKVKMSCPKCGWGPWLSKEKAYRTQIDGVKCSLCFKRRSMFVNLEIVSNEIENRFEILDL